MCGKRGWAQGLRMMQCDVMQCVVDVMCDTKWIVRVCKGAFDRRGLRARLESGAL